MLVKLRWELISLGNPTMLYEGLKITSEIIDYVKSNNSLYLFDEFTLEKHFTSDETNTLLYLPQVSFSDFAGTLTENDYVLKVANVAIPVNNSIVEKCRLSTNIRLAWFQDTMNLIQIYNQDKERK